MNERLTINAMIEMAACSLVTPRSVRRSKTWPGWYRAKGRMHERLAARGGADSVRESAYAIASFAHARRLEEQIVGTAGDGTGWAA